MRTCLVTVVAVIAGCGSSSPPEQTSISGAESDVGSGTSASADDSATASATTAGPTTAGPSGSGDTPGGETATDTSAGTDGAQTATDSSAGTDGTDTATGDSGGGEDCAGHDPNGTVQIYCTDLSKAQPWTLGFDDWEERTLNFGSVSGSGHETEVSDSGQVRMSVEAEAGTCEGITDHGQALAQGYMCSPNDWFNYELTGYFRLDDAASSSSDQDFTIYGGGGRHTANGSTEGCKGSAYKGSYHYADAEVRFGKEQWHVNYDYRDGWQDVPGGIDLTQDSDAWIGMKVIRYTFERNGQAGIRNELWLDLGGIDLDGNPANAWELVTVSEDHPDEQSWGEDAGYCNAPDDDQIMLWGGPRATWRWDDTAATLRLMSAREIVPPPS